MDASLVTIAILFAQLSVLAFGGGNSILPEMQREAVDVQHWVSAGDFTALYAIAQAVPGPNLTIVTLLGWHVAGLAGALTATAANFLPSSLLAGVTVSLWNRFRDHPLRAAVQAGLLPITAGLVAAGATLISLSSNTTGVLWGITIAVAALALLTRRLHPLWLLGLGAAVGALSGFVPA
jgi:chromate transporter